MKSQTTLIDFGTQDSEETWHQKNYKLAHLTYEVLPHYLGKCKRWLIFWQYSTVIKIKQQIFKNV